VEIAENLEVQGFSKSDEVHERVEAPRSPAAEGGVPVKKQGHESGV